MEMDTLKLSNSRWSAEVFWLIYWSASKPTGQFVYPKYKELKKKKKNLKMDDSGIFFVLFVL